MALTKDQTAQVLADAHFQLEDGISRIFRIRAQDENGEHSPLRLLEVNDATIEAGVMPVGLGADPSRGVFYPTVIVELSPGEYEKLERGELALPHDWQLAEELYPSCQPSRAAE
ncbi:MAG: hypothetical protein WBD40_22495 [Tepidisphaeraceae bacterium]